MENEEKKTPAWVWVVLGCSIPVVLIIIFIGGTAIFGYRMAKQISSDTPEQRAERVKDVLGCREIPEGYFPAITISVPFLFQMAMLTDRPFDPKSKDHTVSDEKGLIYVKSIRSKDERKLRDFIEGKADPSEMLGQGNIRLGKLTPVGRGSFEGAGGTLHWSSNVGNVQAHGNNINGLVNLVYVECPADSKFRLAVWYGPDPNAGKEPATPDYAGTLADESEIRAFMSQFSLCGR